MSPTVDKLLREARALNDAGDLAGSRHALAQAADLGSDDARYSLAAALALGLGGDVDKPGALAQLEAVTRHSPSSAVFRAVATASGWDGRGWSDAIALRLDQAFAGDAAAWLDLGLLVRLADPDGDPGLAAGCFLEALSRGELLAAPALARLYAARDERFALPPGPLQELAQRNYLPLNDILAHMERAQKPPTKPARPAREALERRISTDPSQWMATAEPWIEELSASTTPRALPAEVCDFLAGYAAARLTPSQVFDPTTNTLTDHPYRRSLSTSLQPHEQSLTTHAVERIMAAAAGEPWSHGERMVLLVYRPGEFYAPHHDYLAPDGGDSTEELERSGQRVATVLVNLHPAIAGGGTRFTELDQTWSGRRGEMLRFSNTGPDGAPLPRSRHEGVAVDEGLKVLASLWVRARPYAAPAVQR